jgi:hypothetical protein
LIGCLFVRNGGGGGDWLFCFMLDCGRVGVATTTTTTTTTTITITARWNQRTNSPLAPTTPANGATRTQEWLGDIPNLGLLAENGYWCRIPSELYVRAHVRVDVWMWM